MRIDDIRGRGIPLRGDDIDTDRIIPARYLRSTSFEGLEAHLFEDDRAPGLDRHPFKDPRYAGARVLVVNRNFGCGSSREHAPQALYRWGIRAIEAKAETELRVSVSSLEIVADGRTLAGAMSEAAREAMLSGAWDPTTLLLENYDQVERVAGRLPYLTGFAVAPRS